MFLVEWNIPIVWLYGFLYSKSYAISLTRVSDQYELIVSPFQIYFSFDLGVLSFRAVRVKGIYTTLIYEDGIYEFYDFRQCYDIEIRFKRSAKYGLPLSLNLIRPVVCSAETLGMKRLG